MRLKRSKILRSKVLKSALYWLVNPRKVFVRNVMAVIWLRTRWFRKVRLWVLSQHSQSVNRVLSWHCVHSTSVVSHLTWQQKTVSLLNMTVFWKSKNFVLWIAKKTVRSSRLLSAVWLNSVLSIRQRRSYYWLTIFLMVPNCSSRMEIQSRRGMLLSNGTRSTPLSYRKFPVRSNSKVWLKMLLTMLKVTKRPAWKKRSLSNLKIRQKLRLHTSWMKTETIWRIIHYRWVHTL